MGPALERLYGAAAPPLKLTKLKGDASSRSYYRLDWNGAGPPPTGPRSLIAMRLPEDAMASDEADHGTAARELPFLDVQRILAARAIPVPVVYVDDARHRVLLLEDLGDETFEARLRRTPSAQWQALYAQAVDLLAHMHRSCANGAAHESVAFRRRFDRTLLRWELDHFREWGLEALHGALGTSERGELDRQFDELTDELLQLAQGFVHRDYQSRNLMWAAGTRLTVIDFQDALQGPAAYDLVALLCDSYVALELPLQRAMLERYARALGMNAQQQAAFERGFWLTAIQRKLKDAGRFVFIDRKRGNPDFLRSYPLSLRYVGRALQMAGKDALRALLERQLPGFPDQVPEPAPQPTTAGG